MSGRLPWRKDPDNRLYRDQINKARNIIEQAYRNPPGMHELSLRAGML